MRAVEIARVVGVALVEDLGRAHRLRHAIPRGGALDPEGLAVANAAVGNASDAPAIERYGPIDVVARHGDVVLADDEAAITVLDVGTTARLPWDGARRVGYVAFDGGLVVPSVLGGAGTMLSIGRGGHEGRALRRGDVLSLGPRSARGVQSRVGDDPSPVRIVAGPDLDRLDAHALDQLLARAWSLDVRSDRMGTRLVGPPIAHRVGARAITTPMIEGVIECPPDAAPIVLGPEHPTTGGYPVVAVVIVADLARFHRIALGRDVRFALAR